MKDCLDRKVLGSICEKSISSIEVFLKHTNFSSSSEAGGVLMNCYIKGVKLSVQVIARNKR